MNIKILQWNTWYKEDIKNKISLLKEIDAEIYCLQELNILQNLNEFEQIKSELNLDGYLAITKTDHGGQGNAILTKFPIISTFSSHIKEPKIPRLHFPDEGRVYIQIEIETNNKRLTIGTTHMSYTDGFKETDSKVQESKNLLKILKRHQSSFIFTGDLNQTEDSKLINNIETILKNAGPNYLKKTWTTKDFEYNGFKANSLDYRLDYAFTTNDIEVINAEVIDTDYSDHLPILIEIQCK